MDKSLKVLCDALKKILKHLKPQDTPISFLLITGKLNQGKTSLLKQSSLTHYSIETESNAHFFYNQHGVILELGEAWLNQSERLVVDTLKQLNRCHSHVRINGIMLCVDTHELLIEDPTQLMEQCTLHAQLLKRFGDGLGYCVNTAILFTKLDALAGFGEFFHSDHVSELTKPLGFSLTQTKQKNKLLEQYRQQFDQMIEVLGQKIINKLHPARSSLKRTLIREFPIQLAMLYTPILSLIQQIPSQFFQLKAIYFTSAEQGGVSLDKLNKKIQHEYALVIQDKFPQSSNYRAYFIEGALQAFQEKTLCKIAKLSVTQKWLIGLTVGLASLSLSWFIQQYFKTSKLLDETSKELLAYETLTNQTHDKTAALYHLSRASSKLGQATNNLFSVSLIEGLKTQLSTNTKYQLQTNFLPELLTEIEQILADSSQTQTNRYQALKIYLMLAEPEHYSESEVTQWFTQYWNTTQSNLIDKQLILLKEALKQPLQPLTINRQLVSDVRNYLNALPATYLYYLLAKNKFSTHTVPIAVDNFELASNEIPIYYTKAGFKKIIKTLPPITLSLQQENWVLARQDLNDLLPLLEQAYCFEYATWWQNFIHRTKPFHYQTYQQARQLFQVLHQTDSIDKLTKLIQQQTSPEAEESSSFFNQKIASQFTNLNLMSHSTLNELTQNINELEQFLTTLSLINDQGRTAFDLTKARFQGGVATDPLSTLYNRARQLPEPVATWAKQLADDTWFIFINDSKDYLNKQWQQTVYNQYQSSIANRYPFDLTQKEEVNLTDFDQFFAPQGTLSNFISNYLKPFLNTSTPQWQPKELDGYRLPLSTEITNELIRANVISNMFFPEDTQSAKIEFSLQKISLDPVISRLQLSIGKTTLSDNQNSDSFTLFTWPQTNAKLQLSSIEGNHYEIEEVGAWAFFRMLQKVNVLVDNEDSASLQILFEINGNSGRYLLKTKNQINPFSPGILTGFTLKETIA